MPRCLHMELRRYLSVLRRRLPLIIASVVIGLVAAYGATPRTARYTATATVYVGSRVINPDPRSGELSGDRVAAINQIVLTYGEFVRTDAVAAAALQKTNAALSPQALVARTTTAPVLNTTLLRISVTGTDPGESQALANALADSLVTRVAEIEPSRSATSSGGATPSSSTPAGTGSSAQASSDNTSVGGVPATVVDRAELPVVPKPSGLLRNLILGGLFGLVLSVGVVALLEYLDVAIKSADEAERRLELPVLGALPLHAGRVVADARSNGAVLRRIHG